MSQFTSAMRAAAAVAALIGGYAWTCPATATADSNSATLAGMLAKGYSTSNCKAVAPDQDDQANGVLAGYECEQNSMPGGPSKGVYSLFDNSKDTSSGFKLAISQGIQSNGGTPAPCVSGGQAPDTWNRSDSPDTPAGQIVCAGGSGGALLIWSNEAKHMVAMIAGADLTSLYQWWSANG
jgi:serine/threonine kinase PknH